MEKIIFIEINWGDVRLCTENNLRSFWDAVVKKVERIMDKKEICNIFRMEYQKRSETIRRIMSS